MAARAIRRRPKLSAAGKLAPAWYEFSLARGKASQKNARSREDRTVSLTPTATVEAWRDRLIDCDIAVDEARLAVDRAVDALRAAVRERDRTAIHLHHLETLADADSTRAT